MLLASVLRLEAAQKVFLCGRTLVVFLIVQRLVLVFGYYVKYMQNEFIYLFIGRGIVCVREISYLGYLCEF